MHKCLIVIIMLMAHTAIAQNDTSTIYFNIGSYQLTTAQKKSIDSLLYHDVLAPGRRVGIIGYADVVGDEQSNKELSEKRAHVVVDYLQYMGVDTQFIEQVTGVGEVNRAENNSGYPQDRKVAIIPGGFKKVKPVKLVDLTKVAMNATVALDNILFEGGSDVFLRESVPTLEALYEAMRDNPNLKIRVEGHVCCITFLRDARKYLLKSDIKQDEFSQRLADELSTFRAKKVYQYLINNGIDASRLSYKGFGISRPLIIDGKPNTGDSRNRRVEVRILAK